MFKISNRFRWAFCQLEVLRYCLAPNVRRTLDKLPESLDGTYERILKEIKEPNRDNARRLLSCLLVAVHPLRVGELAEILAVDYEDEEGIPRLNPNWRSPDKEQAILTSCSSLITIVDGGWSSRVVQFSHFSVQEYLTSTRLATSSGVASQYHITLEPAHTILAQACMSILLRSDDNAEQNGVEHISQLSFYAAAHWVTHVKYGSVSSYLRKAMEYLFDLDKPYFAAWRRLHDIDTEPPRASTFYRFTPKKRKLDAVPLYYAALCGFQDLVRHLILKYPQHVNIHGGYYVTPLVAALSGEHFQTAKILSDNGADPNVKGFKYASPLHSAAYYGHLRMVQELLEHKADVNFRRYGDTPLHYLSKPSYYPFSRLPSQISQLPDVSRFLLGHGADVNARNYYLHTPLHAAVEHRYSEVELVRVLLEYGADVNTPNAFHSTPLHMAARYASAEVVRVLLEHGADVNAPGKDHSTPLHLAAPLWNVEVVRALLEHGADVNVPNKALFNPLHMAVDSKYEHVKVVRVLLEHGADVNAPKKANFTPLHAAAYRGHVEVVRALLEHGADVNAHDEDHSTPLHAAAQEGSAKVVRVLLEHGADVNALNEALRCM